MDEVKRLRDEGHSIYGIEAITGISYSTIIRHLKEAGAYEPKRQRRRSTRPANETPSDPERNPAEVLPDGHPAERNGDRQVVAPTGYPDTAPHSAEPVQSSADTLADHETRLQVLESSIATLQAQAQQPITVQSSVYALPSAEPVQTWDDPEDAKPERWNLWLPRGLKRRIEAQAKAAGLAPSQFIQRRLNTSLNGGADRRLGEFREVMDIALRDFFACQRWGGQGAD
jgi:hypothetical protein